VTSATEVTTMVMNRIQFQPGLSLVGFLEQYGTEAACARALRRARWPRGFVCPRCEGRRYSRCANRHGERLWQCSACRHQTSLISDTLFASTKLPLTRWFLALYLLTQSKTNIAALELMRHLGVCYRTAWRMKHKVMQAMAEREAERQLGGVVLIDDAYLGGERNGGKVGRGSENKVPFVIAVEVSDEGHPRHAVITPVAGFTRAALTVWAQRHLHPGTDVHSDGLGAFRAVIDAGHAHTVVESRGGRDATEAGGMRWLNTVLSNVKRALDGTYHAFGFSSYAHRYLAEAAWRFNRRFNLKALVPRLLVAAACCKPWPERLLRAQPVTVG
jgi:transposase-like protein